MNAQQVAQTILRQLGGSGRLASMIGAYNFAHSTDPDGFSVQFRFKGSRVANFVKITLSPDDCYAIEFGMIRKTAYEQGKCLQMIYADQLIEIFENHTNLRLRLF
jgi:hypothetical protein